MAMSSAHVRARGVPLVLAGVGRAWPQLERVLEVVVCMLFVGIVAWDSAVRLRVHAA